METAVVDFETEKIQRRPVYPPKPVGVAIRWPDKSKEYLAWGHPTKNNCDIATARRKLKDAYACKRVLFHHAAFDTDVGYCHLGLKPQGRVDDTLFLGFLKDPYTPDLGLKPLAERDLNLPPEEQNELKDWIIANVKHDGRKMPESKWGEHIADAPGDLVGKYAIGDVRRTVMLFNEYMPEIERRGMTEAYQRELDVMPISMEMERSGIRVDRKRLSKCQDVFERMDKDVLRRIAKKLRLDPKKLKSEDNPKGFNLNSGAQLGAALVAADKLDAVVKTPSGGICTKIDVLRTTCNDKELINLLGVHSVAEKYLSSFIRPWLEQSAIAGGYVLPKFNQTRGYNEGGGGARTGRYSSSDPNLQNVSANVEESQNKDLLLYLQKLLKADYHYPFIGLRDFMLPDEGKVMICVDYDQQELHILAHFEKGVLMRAYLENPELDVHDFVRELILKEIGIDFPRKHVKITVFGLIYGMGLEKLAKRLEVDMDTAAKVKQGVLAAVPGIPRMMRELKKLDHHNKPMRTWGGREYFAEEPRFDKKRGRVMDYGYKLFNYLVQGSAADCTKEGMIQVHHQVPQVRIAVQVHDELVVMAPHEKYGPRVARAMCDMKWRVPMSAKPKYSTKSWARAA